MGFREVSLEDEALVTKVEEPGLSAANALFGMVRVPDSDISPQRPW